MHQEPIPAEAGALEERVLAVMRAERDRQMEFGCAPGDEDFAAVIASSLRVALAAAEERAERAERERDRYADWCGRVYAAWHDGHKAGMTEERTGTPQLWQDSRTRADLYPSDEEPHEHP